MHPVYISNGPIGVKESYIQGRVNGSIRGSALSALPDQRQALPTQCLHLEHACTQYAPDVIGQN